MFSRRAAFPPFSGGEASQPATFAGSVYQKFVQRAALFPFLHGSSLPVDYFSRHCLLKVCPEDSPLPLIPSLVHSKHLALSAVCPFQFLVYYSVFFSCRAGVSLSRGLCWFIPGVAVEISHAAYLLTSWSAYPKQFWSQHAVLQEPSCFLSALWL
jgi:hypothetical protein